MRSRKTFDKATNRINSSGYAYDAAGNLINDGFHTYTYDAEGNVISVDGGATASYVYNALNQRVETTTASGSYEYLYDAAGRRISQWTTSSNSGYGARIYWGNQVVASRAANGYTYFEGKDWLGTERIRTDASGNAVATYTSLPFGDGNTVSGSDPNAQQDTPAYAMLDFDNESDTHRATFRQYSDTQGRWMSPDPYYGSYNVNDPQSMNRYTYVLNNPLAYVDPDGTTQVPGEPCHDNGSGCSYPCPPGSGGQSCVYGAPPPPPPPPQSPPPPPDPCEGYACSAGPGHGPTGGPSGYPGGSGAGAGRPANSYGCRIVNGVYVCPSSIDDKYNGMETGKKNYRDFHQFCSTHVTVDSGGQGSHVDLFNPIPIIPTPGGGGGRDALIYLTLHLTFDAIPDAIYRGTGHYLLPAGRILCQ